MTGCDGDGSSLPFCCGRQRLKLKGSRNPNFGSPAGGSGFIDEDWIDRRVGFHQFRDKFNGVEFGDNQWTANGGVGVRIPVAPDVFVSPELRLGFETFVRAAASVGFTF